MSDADSSDTEQLKPPREGETNQIPDVDVGDEIVVSAVYNHEPDRTLTVKDLEPKQDDEAVLLSGYGTEYLLQPVPSINFRRVFLRWKSTPEGIPVSDIEKCSVNSAIDHDEQ